MTASVHHAATCAICARQREEKDTSGLRCDSCGAVPDAGLPAVVGGAHFRRLEHGAGIPGRKPVTKLRTCGKWRAREPGEEG